MSKTKSVPITKRMVWDAYLHIKRNNGVAGVDHQSIADFEANLENNLYKLWNRLASGSYFPPPVKLVEIPKKHGGKRPLGIPTVADRIAQMVIKAHLMPKVEPLFDVDSYGYRPNKSALDAVSIVRKRTWRQHWVIDLDIKGFFDNIDHQLLLKCLRHIDAESWVVFHVERWLDAGYQDGDGKVHKRTKGTPQGGVISPVLANLFLHFVFDKWMRKYYPGVDYVRYADDIIVHCRHQKQAESVLQAISDRLSKCKLTLHPEKTHIVYAGLSQRYSDYSVKSFDFLGFTFRKRLAYSPKQGNCFVTVIPAISNTAKNKIRKESKHWRLHRQVSKSLEEIAKVVNPIVQGWLNYYGKFYRSELLHLFTQIERYLRRWVRRKFAKKTGIAAQAFGRKYLGKVRKFSPYLFVHWRYGYGSPIE